MPMTRPMVIFVDGPEKGRRVALTDNRVIAGRSPQVGLVCSELHISRRQCVFQAVDDGWIVENLSQTSPIRVNGKKYKTGKQILLESGDIVAIGAETHLLFVAPGDDPKQVLTGWMGQHPDAARSAEVESPAPVDPSPVPSPTVPPPAPPPSSTTVVEEDSDQTVDRDDPDAARKRKIRLYAIGFGAYLLLMVLGILILSSMKNDAGPGERAGQPERLSPKQIEKALTSRLQRAPNEVASDRHLARAEELFAVRTAAPENLYLCALHFRLYLAYRREVERYFPDPNDERHFNQIKILLVERVTQLYNDAWVYENVPRWKDAYAKFEAVLRHVPVETVTQYDDRRVYDVLIENVLAHSRYVSRRLYK